MIAEVKLQRVREIAEQICLAKAVVLYDLEYLQGSRTLRVYIDKAETGVSLDDCALVSEELSNQLDTLDIFPEDYNLEVSSPGLERQLRLAWHFDKVKGKKIELKLYQSLGAYFPNTEKKFEKAKTFQCFLKDVKQEELVIDLQGNDFLIPLKNITKANLVFEM
jgi:ribosome maturation factor RimP